MRFAALLMCTAVVCSCKSAVEPRHSKEPPHFSEPTPSGEIVLRNNRRDTVVVNVTLYGGNLDSGFSLVRGEYRNNIVAMSQYLFVNPNERSLTIALGLISKAAVGVDTVEYIYRYDESVRIRIPIRVKE